MTAGETAIGLSRHRHRHQPPHGLCLPPGEAVTEFRSAFTMARSWRGPGYPACAWPWARSGGEPVIRGSVTRSPRATARTASMSSSAARP
jgi:hypothetical protein